MPINIPKKIPLAQFSTFRVGGDAEFFLAARSVRDIKAAMSWAREKHIRVTILGAGSNVLIHDDGIKGLVLKISIKTFTFSKEKEELYAGSGLLLPWLANRAASLRIHGFAFMSAIPGSVGGAIYGNAGCFGWETKDILKSIRVLRDGREAWIQSESAAFSYRTSLFKEKKNMVILGGLFHARVGSEKIIRNMTRNFLIRKKEAQPLGTKAAGSIFKNPDGNFSAWECVDKVGMRGRRIGGALVSEKHANFILNDQNASARDIKKLISEIKKKVKNELGVNLHEEIQYLGFDT